MGRIVITDRSELDEHVEAFVRQMGADATDAVELVVDREAGTLELRVGPRRDAAELDPDRMVNVSPDEGELEDSMTVGDDVGTVHAADIVEG